jgi:hypothetical protein
VIEGIATTGVAGVLRNGDSPTVLLRADMDALPVREATGLDYASTVDGVMHACHDMHVTCLPSAASSGIVVSMTAEAITRPAALCGVTSPYPTVVAVVMAQYKAVVNGTS